MKNSLRLLFTVILLLVTAISYAAINNKIIKVVPADILENKLPVLSRMGKNVNVAFDIEVPSGFLKSGEMCVAVPVFINGDFRYQLPPIVIKGKAFRLVDDGKRDFDKKKVLSDCYIDTDFIKEGMRIAYRHTIPYSKQLRGAVLILEQKIYCACDKPATLNISELYGCGLYDYTDFFTKDGLKAYYIKNYIKKDSKYEFSTKSIFKINSTILQTEQFNGDGYNDFRRFVNEIISDGNAKLDEILIFSSSSPDGLLSSNAKLSEIRASVIKDYVVNDLFSLGIDTSIIKSDWTAENWAGFEKMIPSFSNANKIKEIIVQNNKLDVRENKIKKLSNYREIYKSWQQLRSCNISLKYTVVDGNVDGEEITYLDRKCAVVNTGDEKVGTDIEKSLERYNEKQSDDNANNVMVAYMDREDYENALVYAEKISNNDIKPLIANNKGVLYTIVGEYDKAWAVFEKAQGVPMVDYNIGTVLLYLGKYDMALEYLDKYETRNTVCAYMIGNNVDYALKTAVMCDSSVTVDYLISVAYARRDDDEKAFKYLKKAVSANGIYKNIALNQAEFIKYRNIPAFKEIIDIQ